MRLSRTCLLSCSTILCSILFASGSWAASQQGPDECQNSTGTSVPSVFGGHSFFETPISLLQCINSANETQVLQQLKWPWVEEVSTVRAAASWWSPRTSPSVITVVTQLSVGRLAQLWSQCRTWPGPLSAAVYVPLMDWSPGARNRTLRCAMERAYALFTQAAEDENACVLDMILIYEAIDPRRLGSAAQQSSTSVAHQYPVNVLRNMARLQARSEILAIVDVDMLMSAEVLRWLSVPERVEEMRQRARSKEVFVLPAFEVLGDNTTRAAVLADAYAMGSKDQLLKGIRNRTLSTFAALRYPKGHNATNFMRWADSRVAYGVEYDKGFEPWVMAHRWLSPWHDARFRGYGLNKISHIAHLNASGFKFVVHPEAFIIHRAHEKSLARHKFNSDMGDYYKRDQFKNLTDKYANTYFKVHHLFVVIKQQMDRNRFATVLDPATHNCLPRLPWWPAGSMRHSHRRRRRRQH